MNTYPSEFRYTRDHVWVQLAPGRGHVGVTEYALELLGAVVYVDLPAPGSRLVAGQAFGTIESPEGFKELVSPIAGEVVKINAALACKPEVVHDDPHGSWLIVIEVNEQDAATDLLDAREYFDLVERSKYV